MSVFSELCSWKATSFILLELNHSKKLFVGESLVDLHQYPWVSKSFDYQVMDTLTLFQEDDD